MQKRRSLTGITTSGTPHLGNYVGAIRPAIAASRKDDAESFYFLADYHALIKTGDPARVQRSTLEIAVTAYGFPTVRSTSALVGAHISASIDPSSLVTAPSIAPRAVEAIADGEGRTTLSLPIDDAWSAREDHLAVLVRADYAGHTRTRTVTVDTTAKAAVRRC